MSLTIAEHSSAHSGSHSIVSQIRDLLPLPRHAVFHVKLVIHQLSSVPLMSGQFRIKWKFRNLQAVNSAGRPLGLGRALALKLEKRKGKEIVRPDEPMLESPAELELESPTPTEEITTLQNADTRPESTHSSGQSSNSKQSSSDPTPPRGIDYRPEARGYTPFLPLRDFKVAFEHQIDVAVQMSIDRESLALLPSELKLTVMQRVISGDPDAPLNPRLGHVQLNLAEYADAGSVTRNYLLRRSKVNAMLNMTITVTQISGEDNYRPPPLRKEEIGAGIADFLTLSEPLPALSRLIPTEDPWLSNSLNLLIHQQEDQDPPPPDPPPAGPAEALAPPKKRWRVKRPKSSGPSNPPPPMPTKPARKELHPTEALIEAIFNPYPTTSTAPSPFTYYVPPAPPPVQTPTSDGTGTDGTSRGSFDSSRASEVGHDGGSRGGSGSGSGGGGGGGGGGDRNKWWRSNTGGRPVTPARSNSTRS